VLSCLQQYPEVHSVARRSDVPRWAWPCPKHGPPDLPRSPNPPTGPATGDVTDPLTLMEVGPVSFEEIDPTTGGVGNTGPPAAA